MYSISLLGGYSQQQSTSSAAAASAASSLAITSGSVMTMECPQATMMGNHAEGDLWMVDIQLMYAQHWPEHQQLSSHHEQSIQAQQQLLQQQIMLARGAGGGMGMGTGIGTGAGMMVGGGSHSGVGVTSSGSFKRPEKPLRELLEEQDIGKSVSPPLQIHTCALILHCLNFS